MHVIFACHKVWCKHGKSEGIIVHDNDCKRGYEILQQIADLEIKNTKLWVYKLKPSVMEHDIANMYLKSMNEKL